ncbi:MAG: hypothetical protein A3G00_00080 [Candidatus Magasanikbacteria bacterium RIFCSPLOWO2_12_FULL_43_12]|uniref:DDH domain-containing protein n=1 Tax=Candidatus Magasanikbacteria bacterium RIFCSPLOWO2_12_FULL_43_12 TaxID=1798692 RepID=A0A1F6MRG5_9BACT|nr:MAG: hypothetical protein A3I93_00465 [Candidatus Magasanikbacteria bacterium RIFCSPLOWO2_02_FULL_43_22]OGH74259.1 MAG: hypothetical protein A3G00_00080 [Candidatus Magasanikbacteria bacterium RIFCSPLOWO2_12_FULL_43_12]
MPLTEVEQIKKLLENSKHALVAFHANGNGDAIASGLALALFLEKIGKQVDIVAQDFHLPKTLKFLKRSESIRDRFPYLQKFVITVDVRRAGVQELSYDLKEEQLRIFITPQHNFLSREDIRTAQSDFKYDIIFVLGTPDLEALGGIYDNNTELFYKKPIINIDNSNGNEHFGHINLTDITATSTAEILYQLFKDWQAENIDKDIATALLTGMIGATRSFKSANVQPRALTVASELMHLGADRDFIVQNLYRTRSLATLKLWGQALSHLQHDAATGIVWTTITRDEFVRSGAHADDLYDIIHEIIGTAPEAKFIVLFHEQSAPDESTPRVHIILDALKGYDAKQILKSYPPIVGDKKQATVIVAGKTLTEVEKEIIEEIKKAVR